MSDYDRIARAIEFIAANAGAQPGLDEVAAQARLSPFHFQKLFSRWAGVSPKRFLQVVTVARAKQLLDEGRDSLLGASEEVGLSSSSRLHDHFVTLEAMTPDEYRRQGAGLTIRHGEAETPFGRAFLAWTSRGLCALSFIEREPMRASVLSLQQGWPGATLTRDATGGQRLADGIFTERGGGRRPLSLLVRGTNFQIAVWRALLRIPEGGFAAYGDIAAAIGRPKAVRAVGTAVGANPCAFVIPCHRVIRESGALGGYRWGLTRKQAIQAWEAARFRGIASSRST
jgi:AraC family transcriptional regulator of adaptative response/methylated-DNA-[protein]-cysteine methyltransferase